MTIDTLKGGCERKFLDSITEKFRPYVIAIAIVLGRNSCDADTRIKNEEPPQEQVVNSGMEEDLRLGHIISECTMTQSLSEKFDGVFNSILIKSGISREERDSQSKGVDWIESKTVKIKGKDGENGELLVFTNNCTGIDEIKFYVGDEGHLTLTRINGKLVGINGKLVCETNILDSIPTEGGFSYILECLQKSTE